jgi:hypothetical protein
MMMSADAYDQVNQRLLRAASETYPGWDFRPVFGGWQATPKDTPVLQGADLHSLIDKVADYEENRSDGAGGKTR